MKNKSNPHFELNGFSPMKIISGDGTVQTISFIEAIRLSDMLTQHIEISKVVYPFLELYKDFENKVDGYLDESEASWSDFDELNNELNNLYSDFFGKKKISKKALNQYNEGSNQYKVYQVGQDYAQFVNINSKADLDIQERIKKVSAKIKKDYTKAYGKNTLVFKNLDKGGNFVSCVNECFIETLNREEAKQFLLFVYNTYIKDVLEPWYNGVDEFIKDYNNQTF